MTAAKKGKRIVLDPNCPPGMVYIMDPDTVQMSDAKGKVTKPLKELMKHRPSPKRNLLKLVGDIEREWPPAFDVKFDKPAPKRKAWSPSTLAVNSAERAYIAAWKRLGMDMREALKEAIAAAAKVDGIGK